jgi:hypothetical protein
MIQHYKGLDVWKKSVASTTELYKFTSGFSDRQRYGLTSQLRLIVGLKSLRAGVRIRTPNP